MADELLRFRPFHTGDDVYTVEEFKENTGPFNGYWGNICPGDGTGYWANENGYSWAHPVFDNRGLTEQPDWADRIVWFNK